MRGGIDMRTPLADMAEHFSGKSAALSVSTFVVPVNRMPFFVREAGPVWNAWSKFVSEIDEFFLGQRFLQRPERIAISGTNTIRCDKEQQQRGVITKRHSTIVNGALSK